MTDDGVHSFQFAGKRSAVVGISSPRLWKVLVSFDSVRSQRAMRPRSGSFKLSGSLTMGGCNTTKAQCTWKMTVHTSITVLTVYMLLTCIGMAVRADPTYRWISPPKNG